MNHGALVDPLADRRHGGRLGRDRLRQCTAAALAQDHDNLTFARLVLDEPPVNPIGSQVFRPDMTTEVGAVDLGNPSFTADAQRLHAGGHGLAQLVCQHERRLVLDVELTREGEHALALHLVAEGGDGLCQANRVPEVIEKSPRHALQRHRGCAADRG